MDIAPNQALRLLQLGMVEKAARSLAIWKCVSCLACTTRCPKQVDCAGVMDALRQCAVRESLAAPAGARTLLFQREFLRNIRRHGRLRELELTGMFKTRAFLRGAGVPFLFKDAALAPQLRARGKLHLAPKGVADTSLVDRIFARCGE